MQNIDSIKNEATGSRKRTRHARLGEILAETMKKRTKLIHGKSIGLLAAGVLFAFIIVGGMSPLAAQDATQSLPFCSWRLETDGGGITNVAFPDTDATYWTMPVDTTAWKEVIIKGKYPASRFFSFTTYVAKGAAVDAIHDVDVDPDPGSSNPFRRGSSGQDHEYTVSVSGGPPARNHINFGDTPLGWIIYRIYVADKGLDRMAGVPLPAVTLIDQDGGDHPLPVCNTPRDQQVRVLIKELRANGFGDLVDYWRTKFSEGDDGGYAGGNCQPEDQLVFWIPKNTGAYFPNPFNKYIAGPGLCFQPGKVVIVRGKGAVFPDTYNGNPVWKPAIPGEIQLRYWSMCNNNQIKPFPVVLCQPDYVTNLDKQGFYTYVLGEGDSPPPWLPPDASWLPWGSKLVPNILIFRNMLPKMPEFERSVQAAITAGCVVDNQPGVTPPRDEVIAAGECAHDVMRAYYPRAVFCGEKTFRDGGWRACFAPSGDLPE